VEDGQHPTGASDSSAVTGGSDAAVNRIERIALIYLVVAGVWILVSGALANAVAERTAVSLATLEIAKGLGFVLVTAAALHQALRRWAIRLRRATAIEREAAERMRRAESLRTSFLTGVSHELRTPLTAIVGYSQTIHRDADRMTNERIGEIAGRLVMNAERLQTMVIDLLEVDRLLQGVGTVKRHPADVTELARRIAGTVDVGAGRIDVVGAAEVADIDAAKIERLLQHALDNAVKHSGGASAVMVSVSGDADTIDIRVQDDGCGFPESLLGRLFDPFVQEDDAASRASPGLGIGLTLVAQFAALHGGRAVASNLEDGGALLAITLPRTAATHG
jgi:two-component system, OmpR family, sensor histidine kinase MtrB